MKEKYTILFFALIFFPFSIFSQWERVSENQFPNVYPDGSVAYAIDAVQNFAIASFFYFCDSIGYIDSPLHYTKNNGVTWIPINFPFQESIMDISITDSENFWFATSQGRIIATKDGGLNWMVQFENSGLTEFMNYIEMFDEYNGIAMGDAISDTTYGLIIRTGDGGATWNIMQNNNPIWVSGNTWRAIDFVSIEIGYFGESWIGRDGQGISKTMDGGNNWEIIYNDVRHPLIKFYDEKHGMFINTNGKGGRTFDGGETWEAVSFNFKSQSKEPIYVLPNDLEYVGESHNNVWAVFSDTVFYSSNFGETWQEYIFEGDIHFDDIEFIDENTGWLITRNGIYFTTNNGNMITDVRENIISTSFKLNQNYPNPFNPSTTIKYSIPADMRHEYQDVRLGVYDILGREVFKLVDEKQKAGDYEVEFIGSGLSSGIYFYRIQTNDFVETKKMMLLN